MSFSVLLVDDSKLVQTTVTDILEAIPGVVIFGLANNGQECLDLLTNTPEKIPDLIILDVEMPILDGISTLKEIRKRKLNIKVLMLSVLTVNGALTTFRAMDLGALDFIPKPSVESGLTLEDVNKLIRQQVEGLIENKQLLQQDNSNAKTSNKDLASIKKGSYELLVIGVSTGGPPAIQKILQELPASFPIPIIIIQHMPPIFTKTFSDRLHQLAKLNVVEATNGQIVKPGHVYIAPGDFHLELTQPKGEIMIQLTKTELRFSHRPSIDVTMEQAALLKGENTIGLLMTGMGQDGVIGMQQIQQNKGLTLAQDEKSSTIFGMNKRAIEAGYIDRVLNLDEIAGLLCEVTKPSS